MRRLAWVIIVALGLIAPLSAKADSIKSISTDIAVTQDGVANFYEKILYSFDGQRHGIYRKIPYVGQIDEGKYLYFDFALNGVTRGGSEEPAKKVQEGAFQRITIGNPDSRIGGVQEYGVRYSLSPVVRKDPAGDYITLNVHGTGWDVPAQDVSGHINLPAGATVLKQECFTGKQGEKNKDCIIIGSSDNQNSVQVRATKPLPAGEGMTVDLLVQPGSFQEGAFATISNQKPEMDRGNWPGWLANLKSIMNIVALLIALGVTAIFIRRSMARQARRKQETVVAQFEAPAELSPGQVGLISDEVADSREVTAMLIDLARRGHLTIGYEQQKRFFGTKDRFLLTSAKSADKLSTAEQTLLQGVFSGGPTIYVDELKPNDMVKVVSSVRTQLTDSLKLAGLFAEKQRFLSPQNLTEKGYDVWAQAEGLKLYLNVAEKDRMKFAEAPDKTPERFTKLLPYAIALGVEKQWAKQFEGIDIEPATHNWYHGAHSSSPVLFTNMLTSSFSTNVSSHTSPPSSSGGFGGGFSGGGAGGGGGGSW